MSEQTVMEIGQKIIEKQLELAKAKRDKLSISEIVRLESEIVNLRRDYNNELALISKEEKSDIVSDE